MINQNHEGKEESSFFMGKINERETKENTKIPYPTSDRKSCVDMLEEKVEKNQKIYPGREK
jgi:hypothetical protein